MKFTLDNAGNRYRIKSFEQGVINIDDCEYRTSLVVTTEQLFADWPVDSLDALSSDHLAQIADLGIDVLLLGTGRRQRFPHPSVTSGLASRGIGVEIMDTAAACRTFNVLISEGRAVAAALIID